MKRYTFAAVAVLLVVFPWRQAPNGSQVSYTVENLATSASIDNLVPAETGINASGQVSGTVTDSLGRTRAVRYTDGIGWEFVPGLTWGSTAAGINVHGDIVGTHLVGALKHAYRYNGGSSLIDDIAPLTNGSTSSGLAINDSAEIVGQSDVGSNVQRGFRASPGLPAVKLPTLGGNFGNACGINSSGQVAETSITAGGFEHAARVEADGVTIVDLGSFDGPTGFSVACAIDDLGHVGGFSSANSFAVFRAFRFDTDHLVAVDGTLPSLFANVESIANAASAGWYMSSVTGNQYAMLHTDANGAVDLNTQIPVNSGWVLTEIKGINASGQMVGDGLLNNVAGVFRLTPANQDTTPPVINSVTLTPSTITVVNGQMDNVAVAVSATDDDGKTPTCQLSSISGSGAVGVDYAVTGANSGAVKAVGGRTYVFTVSCSDAAGNKSSASAKVVVPPDTTPPVISSVTASPSTIWPPNHRMVPVTVTVAATDDSGIVSCHLASISGVVVAHKGDDDDDDHDRARRPAYAITGQFSANVRAQHGIAYVLAVTCSDFSGNTSSKTATVTVAKPKGGEDKDGDRKKKGDDRDDR